MRRLPSLFVYPHVGYHRRHVEPGHYSGMSFVPVSDDPHPASLAWAAMGCALSSHDENQRLLSVRRQINDPKVGQTGKH